MIFTRIRLPQLVAAKALTLTILGLPLSWAWTAHRPELRAEAAPAYSATSLLLAAPQEVARLQEVAAWVEEPATLAPTVVQAIREHPESFELFREFHGETEKQIVLDEVPFGREITRAAAKHDVDPLLVASVVEVESHFRPRAGSHKGAVGLMQLLPSTAGMPAVMLFEPRTNLDAGSAYLREMLDRFEGDLELALAAYNAGPTNVRRFGGVPPFNETRNYVQKVLSIYVEHHRTIWQSHDFASVLPVNRQA
jgi:hypothetical protein